MRVQIRFFNLLVLILLFFPSQIFLQNEAYDVKYITTKDGLINGCIQEIIQDTRGYMWFATEGGLNRYDGYNIKLYDCGQKFIRTIFEDPADSGKFLWIGTQGGLFKFDIDRETFLKFIHDPNDSTSISNNDIQCIYKDKNGLYWIGTVGGLNKFDPKINKFISYCYNPNDPTTISSNIVFTICEDYLGQLWVGTYMGGLDRYDRKTNMFIHYKYDPSNSQTLFSNHIFSLFEDSDKILWIGTSWTLFRYDREKNQFIRHALTGNNQKLFVDGMIHSIYEDKEKKLWVVSNGEGVYEINRDRENYKYFSTELNSIDPSSVCIDKSGIIWIGTFCQGINKIIPKKKIFYHYNNIASSQKKQKISWTYSFIEDSDNNLWCGTLEGLKKIENKKIFSYPILLDGTEIQIEHLIKSTSKRLWLANGGCITNFDPQTKDYECYYGKYITYSSRMINLLEKSIQDSTEIISIQKVTNSKEIAKAFLLNKPTHLLVHSMGEGDLEKLVDYGWITSNNNENLIWMMNSVKTKYIEGNDRGSFVGGPYKNREQIALITLKAGKYQLHYHSNKEHGYGDWISGAPQKSDLWGISIYTIDENDYNKYKSEVDEIAYHNIHWSDINSILEDDEGEIWVILKTEENSVHLFDKEKKELIPIKLTLNNQPLPHIERFIKDKAGNLWLTSYDNKIIKKDLNNKCEIKFNLNDFNDDKKKKLNNTAISYVCEDSKQNLWISSDIGLFKFNLISEKIDRYMFKDFLSPNQVEGILEDNNGNLWISASNNIIKFNPTDQIIRKYDADDGLPEIKFAFNSCYKNKNGYLFFGGSDGFVMFHQDSINDNQIVPQIGVTAIKIFNNPVIIGELSRPDGGINEIRKIILNYDQDIFTIEFTSLDYTNPNKNKYAYKMEGVNLDWVYTDANRRAATYTKLDPGNYFFTVKGSNNDGIWNDEGKSLLVIITPPWWKTWWAYLFYIAFIFSIIIISIRLYLNKLRLNHKLELESEHSKKLEEISKIKSNFFANISHEFRTPLTLILGHAEKITNQESKDTVKDGSIITRNSKRLLQLVNQLLDLSKIDGGKLKLETEKGNIVSFIKRMALSFESLLESKDISLKLNPEKEQIDFYFDREKMTKILTNLLSNACKFTPENGKIIVSVNKVREQNGTEFVSIKIKNTGVGIPKEAMLKLFDRFYQVDNSFTKEHEGTGIGLALTKELVELHSGNISVNSNVSEGDNFNESWTEFTLIFPMGKKHLKEEEIISLEENIEEDILKNEEQHYYENSSSESDTNLYDSKTIILLVEDNYDMREYIKESLSDIYQIEEAINGEQGIRIAEKIIPDLIISDLMMPKLDGNELTRILKNDEKTSHIPIILLTAKAGHESKLEGLQCGADDYLTKPFDLNELRIRIENLIKVREKLHAKFSHRGNKAKSEEKKLSNIDEKFMNKVNEVIEKHLSEEEFSIEEFGNEVGMSRTQLHRKLKGLVGKSPSQYVRSIRLNRAKNMIIDKKGNISEIAYSVGFSSPAYFTKCFKDEFDYPPSDLLE